MSAADPITEQAPVSGSPDNLEIAPGTSHQQLEGWIPQLAGEDEIRDALEKAFDYRGDVAITRKTGDKVEGYVFDRRSGSSLADSFVRLIPTGKREKLAIPYSDIAALKFSDRDPAAGKSFEAWVRKYWGKRMAGEKNIQITPEALE